MSGTRNQRFWNRIAARYAARPLKNVAAYEAMLADVAARLTPTDHVLEIGCGTGGAAIRLAPHVAQWRATDFSSEMIRIARAKPGAGAVRFEVADAAQALGGGPFDAICAFNVLHLVDDLPDMLAQIHANLAPDGQLICKSWCFADLPWRVRALFPVLRMIGLFPVARPLQEHAFKQAVLDAGFAIEDVQIFGDYWQNPYVVARKPVGSTA
ncbi:MAG: class I SAM-dependent methyltransferase [Rhodobacterales bacterium]